MELKECNIDNKLKTIYIGGGSPSCLNVKQLEKLLFTLSSYLDDDCEFNIDFLIVSTITDCVKGIGEPCRNQKKP